MITREKELILEGQLSGTLLQGCLNEQMRRVEKMNRMHSYYHGRGSILQRERGDGLPNNRLAHGYARYIVNVASAYLAGSAVNYTMEDGAEDRALSEMLSAYRKADIPSVDMELARQASLFGRGVEVIFIDDGANVKSAAMDPRSAFVVYDEETTHAPLFGISFRPVQGESGATKFWEGTVYTKEDIRIYRSREMGKLFHGAPVRTLPHYFGAVPMVEYWNSDEEESDLESVLSLIDAYDVLESDRVNDREQQVDALLLLYGARLSVDEKGRTPAQQLRQDKLLYLPDREAGAEYLCPKETGGDAECLRAALEKDIHKFSMVPDLSDECFSGNVSGVAIKYKLMGLEQLTHLKERWFREALKERMEIFARFLELKGGHHLDLEKVRFSFRRALPVDALETAQMVKTLDGMVPKQVLVNQLPFMESI